MTQDFLADNDEVAMEEAEGDGCWEIVDSAPAVRAVDSADNSPASSSGSGEDGPNGDEHDSSLELELDEHDLEDDEFEDENLSDSDSRKLRLERVSKDSGATVAMDIRIGLKEPTKDADRFSHLVEVLGVDTARAAFEATMRQEEAGGVLSAQGKRRSPGGAFFELLKNFASEKQMRAINKFRKDKQRASARNKANKEVAKAGGLRTQGRTIGQRRSSACTPGSRRGRGSIQKKRERSPGTGGNRNCDDSRPGRKKHPQRQLRAPDRQRGYHSAENRRHSVQQTPRALTAQKQQDALVI